MKKKSTKKGNLLKGGRAAENVKVRGGKKKKSSRAWLERQLNDPFVKQAHAEGYRGRAVYKIKEMDQTFDLIRNGQKIIDLGCAPGSWLEYIAEKTSGNAKVIGVDLLDIDPVKKTTFIKGDFTEQECLDEIEENLRSKKLDLVLSDMAPNTTGHAKTDHIRIMAMLEMVMDFALQHLDENGDLVAKVFQGGAEKELLDMAKKYFRKVKHFKPQASRKESSEMYLVAKGFKLDQLKDYMKETYGE